MTDKERLDWLSKRKRNKPFRDFYFCHSVERQADRTWASWDGENWHWSHKTPRAAIDAAIRAQARASKRRGK